jgi:phosphoserine aminotransferase
LIALAGGVSCAGGAISYHPRPEYKVSPLSAERTFSMGRIHNFGAGPAALPLPVLEKAQAELLDFQGGGMSIMEMSHRSKGFEAVIKAAEANIRKLLNVSDDYAVLFLQGGASLQFAMLPMNFMAGKTADYVHSGAWAEKAVKEAKNVGAVNVAWDGKEEKYYRMPAQSELKLSPEAAYLHITSNETISGVQFQAFPQSESPLVADMSSDILSREIDVSKFGMIYAGAQKNIGPSGLALVIVRKDWAEKGGAGIPTFLKYKTFIPEPSLYNTPNTWAVYMVKLVTEWVEKLGGVKAIQKINDDKAKLLYDCLDASGFWKPFAKKEFRSSMNVTWRLGSEELEEKFVKEAKSAGLDGLKGHRSVGGIRASIYNAVPQESVAALVGFMKDFERLSFMCDKS